MEGVTSGGVEMGVIRADLIAECGEGSVRLGEGLGALPGLALCSCIMTCPMYPLLVRSRHAIAELVNIIKKRVEANVIGCELRGVSAKCQRPMDNGSHDLSVGTRAEGVVRGRCEVQGCW